MKKLQKTLLSLLTIPTVILSSCGLNSSTNNSTTTETSSTNDEIVVIPAETPSAPVLATPETDITEEISEETIETSPVAEPETVAAPVPTPAPPAPVTPTPAPTPAVVETEEKKEAEKVTTDTKEEEVTATPDTSDSSTEAKTEESNESAVEADTSSDTSTEEASTEEVKAEETVTEEVASNTYKNGSYTQSGSYGSPAGSESISVTLSIADDTVSSVSVSPNATHAVSKKFQDKFAGGISGQVVGKKLSELGSIGAVNGSSLTGGGFNSAIASIKNSAK